MYDFFFFQAEDGIRDTSVTGVQTCALPIFGVLSLGKRAEPGSRVELEFKRPLLVSRQERLRMEAGGEPADLRDGHPVVIRSEERRVGKSVGQSRGRIW